MANCLSLFSSSIPKKWYVSEVINFVPLLNYLKIKQSWFEMIYDHVSSSQILSQILCTLLEPKINISFKITLSKDHQYVFTQSKDPRKKLISERACQKLFIHQRRSIIKNGICSSRKRKGKEHDTGKLVEGDLDCL